MMTRASMYWCKLPNVGLLSLRSVLAFSQIKHLCLKQLISMEDRTEQSDSNPGRSLGIL